MHRKVLIFKVNTKTTKRVALTGAGSLVAIAGAIANDILPFHYFVFFPEKNSQSAK